MLVGVTARATLVSPAAVPKSRTERGAESSASRVSTASPTMDCNATELVRREAL
jgi:hypothetical protein